MKLKTNFLDKEKFESLANNLRDIDFTSGTKRIFWLSYLGC